MATSKDSFDELERHRKLLEQNVDKLFAALDEWRQWKLEYRTLRERVESVETDAPPQAWAQTRAAFQGDLVDDKVLADIFGQSNSKKCDQVVSILTNRLDYVVKNISTLEKQLATAENKLAAANVIGNPDVPEDEDGLPITEILEELDDEGNVVSYSLRTPGSNQNQLLNTLQTDGVEVPSPSDAKKEAQIERSNGSADTKGTSRSPASSENTAPGSKPKKGVSFAEDTKSAVEEPKFMSISASQIDELMREAKNQESIVSNPVIPADESGEDAQLRRDMLQYNLSELNPVVAELNLEEGDLTDTDEFDVSEDEDEDDDDDEDQWGRSKSSVINEEYRQKMREIEKRLRGQSFTPGSSIQEDQDEDEDLEEGIGRIHIKNNNAPSTTSGDLADDARLESKPASTAQKSVRFAPTLDVANEPAPKPIPDPPQQPRKPEVDPLSDVVIERKGSEHVGPAMAPAKKASRFRMGRAKDTLGQDAPVSSGGLSISPEKPSSDHHFAPFGPEGQTMAESVLERASSSKPKEPDELDADMLKQQVAVEYHKVRNRMIQKQGGFMKEDESSAEPLAEDEGGPRRLSRFKAARLAKS